MEGEDVPHHRAFKAPRPRDVSDAGGARGGTKSSGPRRDRQEMGGGMKNNTGGNKNDSKRKSEKEAESEAAQAAVATLFFGQLPFETKAADITPWLKTVLKRDGCAEDIKSVRLAGGDGTGRKFKGEWGVPITQIISPYIAHSLWFPSRLFHSARTDAETTHSRRTFL